MLDTLHETRPSLTYRLDGEPAAPPQRVEAIFEAGRTQGVLLCFLVGEATMNCHFFVEDEIEFDLDPREIGGPAQAEALTGFMALLGRATAKTVVLTMENAREAVIFRYSVESDEVVWVEADPGSSPDDEGWSFLTEGLPRPFWSLLVTSAKSWH